MESKTNLFTAIDPREILCTVGCIVKRFFRVQDVITKFNVYIQTLLKYLYIHNLNIYIRIYIS